jgi:hypothetical protein
MSSYTMIKSLAILHLSQPIQLCGSETIFFYPGFGSDILRNFGSGSYLTGRIQFRIRSLFHNEKVFSRPIEQTLQIQIKIVLFVKVRIWIRTHNTEPNSILYSIQASCIVV